MKNFFFSLIILCALTRVSSAETAKTVHLQLISEEISPEGSSFILHYVLKTSVDLELINYRFKLPPGVFLSSLDLPLSLSAGDSIVFPAHLKFTESKVSFFAQTIGLIVESESGNQFKTNGKIYFTPWATVQSWNHPDFYGNPTQRWLGTQATSDSTRISLLKSQIPTSDIELATDHKTNVQWVSIPGLAYEILMSSEKAANYINYSGDDQLQPANARVSGLFCTEKDGVVKGRLMQRYINDLDIEVEFPLQHIYVRLRDNDPLLDDELGSTYTDANGNFEIKYETCQFNEGNLELFLEFVAKTRSYQGENIQALTTPINVNIFNLDGNQVQEKVTVGSAGNDFHRDMGNLYLGDESFMTVHRAFQCKIFSQPHLTRNSSLDILMYQEYGNSFYLPDRLIASTLTPKIFLQDGDEITEETIYHEYGHHVFYMVTNYRELPLYLDNEGSHSYFKSDHPYGAFNEGWAHAFYFMMDAHPRLEDKECGYEEGRWPEHEVITTNYLVGGSKYLYTKGIQSEYLIGAAIYDLWDGEDKGLPLIPTRQYPGFNDVDIFSPAGTTNTVPESSWSPGNEDDVSLGFGQIIKALEGNPLNIFHFFVNVINRNGFAGEGCNTDLQKIEKVFRNNWVVGDIEAYRAGLGTQMSYYNNRFTQISDTLVYGYVPNINKLWIVGSHFEKNMQFVYKTANYNWGEQNTIEPGDFLTVNERYERITQPLLIDREDNDTFTRTLTFTGAVDYELCNNLSITVNRGILDLQNQGQFIISQNAILEANDTFAEIIVRENTQLVIYDKGILRLNGGGARLNLEGELHIYPGGTLSIDGHNAGINVRGNGKIIIHPGAYVCVNDETHMSFSKSMAEQLEFTTYHLGVHPDWQNQFGNVGCWKLTYALASNLGLQLIRTNQLSCNNTNFGYQITGPQLPADAQICWYFPSTWNSWVTSQNCKSYITNATGTVNNWQQGNYQGGEVSVIVKANGKIQELIDVVPSSVAPKLTLIEPTDFNGTLDLCTINKLVVEASGTTPPYHFDWQNHWNLNYGLYNQNFRSRLTLNPEQWVFDLQTFQVNAKDSKGCVTNTIEVSVTPSSNDAWIPRPLNYPESANKATLTSVGRINNNFALSKISEHIYFTDHANNLRYVTFDNDLSRWVDSEVLAENSAGSVALVENQSEVVVYFKSTSNTVQSVRYDRISKTWGQAVTHPTANDIQSHLYVNSQKQLFYRSTSNQLVRILPNNSKLVVASNVAGANLLQVDQKLFFTQANGLVYYLEMNTNQVVNALGSNAKNETMLRADTKKNVYYLDTNGDFQQIPFNGTNYNPGKALSYKQVPSTAWKSCTGYFDINKQSDVFYYVGSDQNVYQLYQRPSGEWESVHSNYSGSSHAYGCIAYRYPHAYYMSNNVIYNLFYLGGEGCNALQRQGVNNLSVDESTFFITYPNPTQSSVSLQMKDLNVKGRLELISTVGEVVFSEEITTHLFEWHLESVNSGLYLVMLKDLEGNIIQSEKLMVVK